MAKIGNDLRFRGARRLGGLWRGSEKSMASAIISVLENGLLAVLKRHRHRSAAHSGSDGVQAAGAPSGERTSFVSDMTWRAGILPQHSTKQTNTTLCLEQQRPTMDVASLTTRLTWISPRIAQASDRTDKGQKGWLHSASGPSAAFLGCLYSTTRQPDQDSVS